MASVKSIITPVEKNLDGTVRQKAIVTGAIPKRPQSTNQIPSLKPRKPVVLVTTPRRGSGSTPRTARVGNKLRSGLTPIRPKPVQKFKSGLLPIRPCLAAESASNRSHQPQEKGSAPTKLAKEMVTIQKEINKEGANNTFEIPQQRKPAIITHSSWCGKSQKYSAVNYKQFNAASNQKVPSVVQRPVATKNSGPKMTTRVAVTFATRLRRSSNLGATPRDRKGKSRIPVPINPNQVQKHVKKIEDSVEYLIKREKELMDELTEVRKKLLLRQGEKFKESIIRSVGANALPLAYDSPASAFNLRPPNSSSTTLKKSNERITVDIFTSSREDLDFSTFCNSPIQKDIPVDLLLSMSKSKTPSSIFENYRRNCSTLRSPRSVKRFRRSRSLSTHRMVDEDQNNISERVLVQLKSLYG